MNIIIVQVERGLVESVFVDGAGDFYVIAIDETNSYTVDAKPISTQPPRVVREAIKRLADMLTEAREQSRDDGE